MNKFLLPLLLFAASAFGQGSYPYVIASDYRQGTYNGGRNSYAIEKILSDLSLDEGSREIIIVFDGGEWAITNNITFPAGVQIDVPSGCGFTVHTNKILKFDGSSFSAENFPIFFGTGTVTGCLNSAVTYHSSLWGGQWTNEFNGLYYLANCAGYLGSDDLGTCSVSSVEICDGGIELIDMDTCSVDSRVVCDDSLDTNDLATCSVASDEVCDDSLTTNDLGTCSVASDEICDGSIGVDDLDTDALGALTGYAYYASYRGATNIYALPGSTGTSSIPTAVYASFYATNAPVDSATLTVVPAAGVVYEVEMTVDFQTLQGNPLNADHPEIGLVANWGAFELNSCHAVGNVEAATQWYTGGGANRYSRDAGHMKSVIIGNGVTTYTPFFANDGGNAIDVQIISYTFSLKQL